MAIAKEFLHFPPDATVGEVLSAYRRRKAQWWWFLTPRLTLNTRSSTRAVTTASSAPEQRATSDTPAG